MNQIAVEHTPDIRVHYLFLSDGEISSGRNGVLEYIFHSRPVQLFFNSIEETAETLKSKLEHTLSNYASKRIPVRVNAYVFCYNGTHFGAFLEVERLLETLNIESNYHTIRSELSKRESNAQLPAGEQSETLS